MPHSHHSHSGQFCRHAKDTLEDVVAEAVRQGFQVFGLSEHAPRWRVQDLYPEESDLTPQDLLHSYRAFLTESTRLRALHASSISLLIGIETDYITLLDSEGLDRLLLHEHAGEIDYVVGSVHHVHGVAIDFDRPTWLRAVRDVGTSPSSSSLDATATATATVMVGLDSLDEDPRLSPAYTPSSTELEPFLVAYLDTQYALLERHRPEVVGHFDLCLLWVPDASLSASQSVWDRVVRNVTFAIDYGALFEANAAAIRKGWSTSYPSRAVLRLILELGGKICLSDDSHGVSYVGLNYHRMRDYLVAEGVADVWYLVPAAARASGDEKVGERGRVVARKLSGWDKHEFWQGPARVLE